MSEFVCTTVGSGFSQGPFNPGDLPTGEPPWEYVVGPEPIPDDSHDEGAGD